MATAGFTSTVATGLATTDSWRVALACPARAVTLAPGWVEVFLLGSTVGIMLMTTATVGRIHDDLAASERKNFLQAWHLRKMVE